MIEARKKIASSPRSKEEPEFNLWPKDALSSVPHPPTQPSPQIEALVLLSLPFLLDPTGVVNNLEKPPPETKNL